MHNFHALTDEDWPKIEASGGVTYGTRTSTLVSNSDTYLYLFETDCATLLTVKDDYSDALA